MHAKTIDLKNRVLEYMKANTPIRVDGKTLSIENLSFTEPDALNDIHKQLEMKYEGSGNLVGHLKGNIIITSDATGKVLSKSALVNLIPIYYMTDRNTYIVGGNEKNLSSSMIRNPGVYTEKDSDNVVTSSFMFDKTKVYVPAIDIIIDPVTNKFSVVIGGKNTTKFNGINFLREFGFTDPEISRMIGNDQMSDNLFSTVKNEKNISDICKAITGKAGSTLDKSRIELMEFLSGNEVFGDAGKKVNKATLGLASSTINKDIISRAVKKAFLVVKSGDEQDDSSDLRFKPVLDDNDLIMREIDNDFKKFQKSAITMIQQKKNDWKEIRDLSKLGSGMHKFMSRDPLSQSAEQTNPLFMASIANRITQLAEASQGGISKDSRRNLVKPRNLKPLGMNRLDPVETPESGHIGFVEHLTQGAILRNQTIYVPVLKVKNGAAIDSDSNTVEISPDDEYDARVAFYDSRYVSKDGNKISFTKDIVPGRYQGKNVDLHVSEIKYLDKTPNNLFNFSANMIPYVSHDDGNRAMMGTNMQRQAILLKNREAPLVMTSVNGTNKTYEELIGELHGKPVKSTVSGVIHDISDKAIIIKDDDGKLHNHQYYNYFPLNQSYMHNEVLAKPGDRVKPGDMIAEGWSTKDGKLALGRNTRVAYLPFKGYNYEDGIVVSKDYANKMATEEIDEKEYLLYNDYIGGRGSNALDEFRKYARDPDFTNLDNDGIIKIGSKFGPGSTLMGYLKPRKKGESTGLDRIIAGNSKYEYKSFTIPRTSYEEGTVKRVHIVKNPESGVLQKIVITYISSQPLKLGDKLSGKHGNKGTITRILPTDEMPLADGKPLDMIYSPLAVPSRKNLGQLLELGAGLIAEKTGKSIVVNNFDHTSKDTVLKGLKSIGFPDGKMKVTLREKNSDGTYTNIETDNPVTVGNAYIMKLKHRADDKIQARSNLDNNPKQDTHMPSKTTGVSKGEKYNPQSFGEMEQRALQAHGAVWNILESSTVKADGGGDKERRMAIFSALSTGTFNALDYPATPETIKVLSDSLKALGLNMQPINDGRPAKSLDDAYTSLSISPIKPSEMIKTIGIGNRVTEHGLGFKAKEDMDLNIPGGLQDPNIFGEPNTEEARRKWGYIKLATPVPNPVLLKSVSYNPYSLVSGVSSKKLIDLMTNKHVLITDPEDWSGYKNDTDKKMMSPKFKASLEKAGLKIGDIVPASVIEDFENEHGERILWKAGGEGIQHILDNVDLDTEIAKAKVQVRDTKDDKLDKAYKKYKALMALKINNMRPSDLMLHYVPVAPTYLRPVVLDKGKDYTVDNLNKLYSNIIKDNNLISSDDDGFNMSKTMPAVDAANMTKKIYTSVSDLFGRTQYRDPRTKMDLQGIEQKLKGKEGLVRKQMLSKKVDFSGRAVIGVDPELTINQVGIPYDMARVVYKPFIFRELMESLKVTNEKEALTKWENSKDIDVKNIINKIAKDRPVIINRQPSLHKFSIQAYEPVIREHQDGEIVRSIQLNPLIVTGFNADFDGDCLINSVFVRSKELDIIDSECYNNIRGDEKMPFAKDTKIRYKYGIINLGNFPRTELKESIGNKEIYNIPDNIEVLTVWNGEEKWLPVESFSIHKDLDMLEVKTNTSRTLQVSNDHSLVTIDNDLSYMRAPAILGMTMPRLRKPVKDNIEFIDTIALPDAKESKYVFQNTIPVDFSFGYVNGIYIGDGWTNTAEGKLNAICLASDTKFIPDKIKEIISSYADTEIHICSVPSPHDYEGKDSYCEKHTWHSSRFALYFKEQMGHGAENKHLPLFWMNTPESFRWGLLSGLIDTDGSIAGNTAKKTRKNDQIIVNYTTISRGLSYEIVALAHTLNLTASVCVSQTPKGNPCYVVVFTQESMERMQQKLYLATPAKQKALQAFVPGPDYKRNKYTPKLSTERLKELRALIGSPRVTDRDGNIISTNIEATKKRKSLYSVLYRVEKENTAVTRQTALDIFELNLPIFTENEFWMKWKVMVEDERIEWEMVTEIKPIPFITEAYDLTIPPAYTMVTESGLVVYDTMALHVPITEKAREEAVRIMQPSTNLINHTDGKMIIEIRHEMSLGIYYLTMNFTKPEGDGITFGSYSELRRAYRQGRIGARTKVNCEGLSSITAGQAMFLLLLPEEYRGASRKIWTSKDVQNLLVNMYRDCEKTRGKSISLQKLSQIIDDIKKLGFEGATRSGISIGITDFKKMESAERIFKEHVDAEMKKGKNVAVATIVGWREAEKVIKKKLETESGAILGENNPIKIIMDSGARANADQIRRMMVSVGVGSDVENKLTQPVKGSHLDGLSPQEFWAHSFDARKGMYDRSVSTSAPGALSRDIWSATQDMVIRENDCETKDGIYFDINKSTVIGRYLAEDIVTEKEGVIAKKNQLVTYELRKKAFDDKVTLLKVRSPLKCKTVHGVCQKCYGALPGTMKLAPIGMAIGVIASQSMGEPVTQMTMNTFHSGGTASTATIGLPRIQKLLDVSENPGDKASIAMLSGDITKITIGSKGTADRVFIGNKVHIVPHTFKGESRSLKVGVGDRVTAGDFLTHGDLNDIIMGSSADITNADPKALFKYKSMGHGQEVALDYVQNYLTRGMEYAFEKTVGTNNINDPRYGKMTAGKIDSRHLETIVSKLTSVVTVTDQGDSPYQRGQVIERNQADAWNIANVGSFGVYKAPLAKASNIVGKISGDTFRGKDGNVIISKGEVLTSQNIGKLLLANVKEIRIVRRPIKYNMQIESISTIIPEGHENWLSNLGHENIFEQISRGVTLGQTDVLDDPRSRLMTGKLLRIGKGLAAAKDNIATKMFNLFSDDK